MFFFSVIGAIQMRYDDDDDDDWQVTLCDPHLSALEVRFSRRCPIQIDVYLTLLYLMTPCRPHQILPVSIS